MAKSNIKIEKEHSKDVKSKVELITDLKGNQTIIGKGGNLVIDKEYKVTDKIAMILINKGFATLKTK